MQDIFGTFCLLFVVGCLLFTAPAFSEENKTEEYKFEASETEKKPYQLGGYMEAMPILFGLDRNASL
jgi:hypothetical protein